ncbi:MAG: sensor histidine kinase [Bacteroidota bacterium]
MKTEEKTIRDLREKVRVLEEQLKAYEQNERLFRDLVETAVGSIGEDFFDQIVIRLSEWLNAECVIIGKMAGPNRVEGFPMYLDGEFVRDFSYTLENTPCDLTSRKGYCVYEDNLKDLFPLSKDVQDLQALGYVGAALYNDRGEPSGILCAMSRKKLSLPPQAEGIIKIVGARISSEMERIKAGRELEQSGKELRASNAAKDKFFSIIAHDLKDPFNIMTGFTEAILEENSKNNREAVDRFARLVLGVTKQTHTLLNNLLDWSLVKTGGMAFNPELFRLKELSSDQVSFFRNLTGPRNITLSDGVPEDLDVFGDKNMIATILRNLLTNAVKYTPDFGLIVISASMTGKEVEVTVTDNGIGIGAPLLEKLFSMEENISTRGLHNEKGTGLGLLLCREFIEMHGGRINVASVQGEGSRFSFTLPCN